MRSDSDAQKKRPPMLKSEMRPVKPAADAAEAPKISCSIGDAMPITPIPALTFRHSTAQISQNCFVLCASRKCTLPAFALRASAGGTRYANAPLIMNAKYTAARVTNVCQTPTDVGELK